MQVNCSYWFTLVGVELHRPSSASDASSMIDASTLTIIVSVAMVISYEKWAMDEFHPVAQMDDG